MAGLPLNLFSSTRAVAERFRKLYRILYISFLQDDFVHIDDFKLYAKQMNAKLVALEAAIAAGDAAVAAGATATATAIGASLAAHTHIVVLPAIPAGPGPSGPAVGVVPPPPPAPAPAPATPTVEPMDSFLQARGTSLLAEGPATAPLGDGMSVEANKATRTALESTLQLT